MKNALKEEILKGFSHWDGLPNGEIAHKIFKALCLPKNRKKEEFTLEDIYTMAGMKINKDDFGVVLCALPILASHKNPVLESILVYVDDHKQEFRLKGQCFKYKDEIGKDGVVSQQKYIEHPVTHKIIENPEAHMYMRFIPTSTLKELFVDEKTSKNKLKNG